MKLNNIKSIVVAGLFATAATITSCDVERLPFDAIEQSQAFNSLDDAAYWRNMIYAQLRGRVYGMYTISQDVQADQLNASSDYGNRNGAPHRWDFNSDDYTIRDVWTGYYGAITNLNIMLEGFETIPTANVTEQNTLDLYKGEAHLARAFYYHNLVVRYGKMYDPQSASSDLGVPIMATYDVNARPARSTVQEVYEFVLADISSAKSALSSVAGEAQSGFFTRDVVLALEARVRLYMQDWSGAKAVAEELIGTGNYPLYNTAEQVKDMWHIDLPNEDIFSPILVRPDELPPANGIYLGYNVQNDWFVPDFLPSQWVVDAFSDNDYRKDAYFLEDVVYLGQTRREGYWLVNKYPGNPVWWTGAATNYVHKQKVFRIGEAYLIASEASFRANNASAAIGHLNTLRAARGLGALPASLSGNALLGAVKDERFKELAFEGFRLDDLRRWGEGFSRRDPQDLVILTNSPASNFTQKSVTANDPKFTWGIPAREETVNENIVQNSGW